MTNVWGVHTKDDRLFLEDKVIAMGWKEMQDLSELEDSRDAFKAHYTKTYPNEKKGAIAPCAGMLYRFIHEIQNGDYVIYPSKPGREIYIGTVEGEYLYNPAASEYVHQRKVKWIKHFPRTMFSQGALYEIGAIMTLFAVKNYADEFLGALEKGFPKNKPLDEPVDPTVAASAEQIEEASKDYIIKQLSKNYKGYPLEDVVNDLLNAMGYHTRQSKQGGDSGIDIVAFKDELPPRIVVQVKSVDKPITENTLQAFKGAMAPGDYGWFVALSDYTPNAKAFLGKNPQISGINGAQLAELIMKYYAEMSDKYTRMFPMKRVYIPIASDEGVEE